MILLGIVCYFQKTIRSKTSKIFFRNIKQLYCTIEIRIKDLFNSNDFSFISMLVQNLSQIYGINDNLSNIKRLYLISTENSIILEENFLKTTYFRKIKNFSYWHFSQWILEKEFYLNFYFFSGLIYLFFLVNPGNYYIDNFVSSGLKREKTKIWVILVMVDIFNSIDQFKELNWNLKLIFLLTIKKMNKDILFNISVNLNSCFQVTHWKFLTKLLENTNICNGCLISSISTLNYLED